MASGYGLQITRHGHFDLTVYCMGEFEQGDFLGVGIEAAEVWFRTVSGQMRSAQTTIVVLSRLGAWIQSVGFL